MTLVEDLGRLKVADPETWDYYIQFKVHENIYDEEALGYILQGCIQRAIQARGWHWLLEEADQSMKLNGTFLAYIADQNFDDLATYITADTPAEAILVAYLAAIQCVQPAPEASQEDR